VLLSQSVEGKGRGKGHEEGVVVIKVNGDSHCRRLGHTIDSGIDCITTWVD
jgi:hypothetical protein